MVNTALSSSSIVLSNQSLDVMTTGTTAVMNITTSSFSSRKNVLPKGATEHLDWANLIQKISLIPEDRIEQIVTGRNLIISSRLGNKLLGSLKQQPISDSSSNRGSNEVMDPSDWRRKSGLHQLCHIDNTETDTQASIWADNESKRIVIAFRGTEQVKIKDILTDINIIQTPYEEGNKHLRDVRCHLGFLTAFKSVRGAVLQLLRSVLVTDLNISATATVSNQSGREIYVTGHSLGGALATLMTFELARLQSGKYWSDVNRKKINPFKVIDKKKLFVPLSPDVSLVTDSPSLYRDDDKFLQALRNSDIRMYRYL